MNQQQISAREADAPMVPPKAVKRPFYDRFIEGTGWTIADEHQFFNTNDKRPGTTNAAEKGALTKQSDYTITNLSLAVDISDDDPRITQELLRNLHKSVLQVRINSKVEYEFPTRLATDKAGVSASGLVDNSYDPATPAATANAQAVMHNGVIGQFGGHDIPGGIKVKKTDTLEVILKFNGTAPVTYINTNNTGDASVYLNCDAYIHDPEESRQGTCGASLMQAVPQ